ncbi:MAG: hypothetical protein D3908_02815, partial [Candidatus Electrothrix sp. AUS4]|nr:hypothetical protein [Candidatus Electrothrix sp. AUS4]
MDLKITIHFLKQALYYKGFVMKSPFYFIHTSIFLSFLFLSAYCLPSISHAEDDPELEDAISFMQWKLVSEVWPSLQNSI